MTSDTEPAPEASEGDAKERPFVVVWLLAECFLPRELRFRAEGLTQDVLVFPFETDDTGIDALVVAALRRAGLVGTYHTGRKRQLAAIVCQLSASGWESATARTETVAQQLITTLAFRQEGLGRLIGSVVIDPQTRQTMQRINHDAASQVTWLPFQPEDQEVVFQWSRIHSTPQGPTLARFYAEACQEANPTVAVARFWALLESLGEQLPGNKLDHGRRVLEYCRQTDPDLDGVALTTRAYAIRNDFMHSGRLAPEDMAWRVREELKHRLMLVFFQIDWKPLPRDAPRVRPSDPG